MRKFLRVNANATDLTPFLLLIVLSLTLGVGITMAVVLHGRRPSLRRFGRVTSQPAASFDFPATSPWCTRPALWVAVRTGDLLAVQRALGLHNAKPCSCQKGFSGEEKLFIAPPMNGWVLVVGFELPDPADDPDVCFHFLTGLSRKLGEVQMFSSNRALYDHGWVRAENGRIVRAYAWSNRTLWNQGAPTAAERELDLVCFDYSFSAEACTWQVPDGVIGNVDKVPLLAARWSIDPAAVYDRLPGQEHGVAGER